MRASGPPLTAIFRTQVQADILARVLLADEPIADLARELEGPIPGDVDVLVVGKGRPDRGVRRG
jgi:hypothetical protein